MLNEVPRPGSAYGFVPMPVDYETYCRWVSQFGQPGLPSGSFLKSNLNQLLEATQTGCNQLINNYLETLQINFHDILLIVLVSLVSLKIPDKPLNINISVHFFRNTCWFHAPGSICSANSTCWFNSTSTNHSGIWLTFRQRNKFVLNPRCLWIKL
jgi:hypothetical protein